MNKTDQTRPGFTKYGQVSCITPGCDEPPLSPKKLCANCQWPDAKPPKVFVEPVDADEFIDTGADTLTKVDRAVAPEVHADGSAASRKTRSVKPAKTTTSAKPVDDDAKRAIRLARSKAWHAKQKALKAAQ